ncbi:MAG: CoA ester lyase [Proteobacteria bacterium]|nr:CoA ester lyase [Pseudomonadota bacterium]
MQAPPRSWLFVPGDSARKQARALQGSADALILDLEDSVDPARLPAARAQVCELLGARTGGMGPALWVRVNAAGTAACAQDMDSLYAQSARTSLPAGIVLPKVNGAGELAAFVAQLAQREARSGLAPEKGARILALVTETPAGLMNLPRYPDELAAAPEVLQRLAGLTWGAEDLGAALGALERRDDAGNLTFTFQLARTACLLTAAALGVQAVDGVHTDFRNPDSLRADLAQARRDGFTGKLAIHPDQVEPINAAFSPTAAEIAHARQVVAAFAAQPGTGVASLQGRMIDRPHLLLAQRVLATAQRTAERP